jgi:hypothetical protein
MPDRPPPRRIPQTPAEHEFYTHLETLATLQSRYHRPAEWVYDGPVDFVLHHGQW